ncbi:MAG TPA: preprotein translocase subunit SecG [Elusimicrobiota bacterium]|nr:preprotein translocase subunit SecG [Elusimicrobiota bacterium]
MYTLALTIHVIICALVIFIVLIQSGKGAGLSGVFGAGGGDALFSAPSGTNFIKKLTTGLAIGFFLTALTLTYLSARRGLRTVTQGPWTGAGPAGAMQPVTVPVPAPSATTGSQSQIPSAASEKTPVSGKK